MSRIGWLDCSSGVSGDMLLGALVDAGVPQQVLTTAVDAVTPEPLALDSTRVDRNGLTATQAHVVVAESHHHRTWADVRALLDAADLAEPVAERARQTFQRLAEAEAKVHGTTPESIHFHEVGALDAIADVVGVCAGLDYLGLEALHASPVAVGSGSVVAAHGTLPVPVPAVVHLLADACAPTHAGETAPGTTTGELCTPTGAALLATHVRHYTAQPPMVVQVQGYGAGSRDTPGRANVVRLFVGDAVAADVAGRTDGAVATQVVLETNVDDLDPRLWPDVLTRLLDAGAADAWLTPIGMKKGRPAHQLSVLAAPDRLPALAQVVVTETSAIGFRTHEVTKHALPRTTQLIHVGGQQIRVKTTFYAERPVNAQPEYADVLTAAHALGRPTKAVLAEALAAAYDTASRPASDAPPGGTHG